MASMRPSVRPSLHPNLRAKLGIAYVTLVAALVAGPALAEVKLPVPAVDQSAIAKRGFFYVGGHYVGDPGKHIMQGQIYVEVLAPKVRRRPYPLVLIHGAAQTATNWMGTPDGREGWAEYFVGLGYVVYMIDQPMRGRSAYHPSDRATRTTILRSMTRARSRCSATRSRTDRTCSYAGCRRRRRGSL